MDLKFILTLCLLSLALGIAALDCNLPGCESCNTPNVCAICQQDYVIQEVSSSGALGCIRASCPENCAVCNDANQCQTCTPGYELTSSGSCSSDQELLNSVKQIRILADVSGNQTNISGNQTSGNQTNGNYSNCTIPGCEVCEGNDGCAKCKPNHKRNSKGICISCKIPNCNSCSTPDVCDQCTSNDTSLTLSSNGAKCLACSKNQTGMAGCMSCSGPNECGQCSNGFQLVISKEAPGICVKCPIKNCIKCGVQAANITTPICEKCDFGYSPSKSGDSCIQCMFPCDTCSPKTGPNNCATCATPFHFKKANDDGSCKRKLIAGCEELEASNSSRCSKCEVGYNLKSDSDSTKCVWFCPENCVACTNATMCSQCAPGFFAATKGSCSKCQTKGCGKCSSDGVDCVTCLKGFYLIDKECKKCPGFCADCTSNSTCVELVIVRFQVLIIIDGMVMLAVCDSACATCSNMNPEVCLECSEGHFLQKGKCKRCKGGCKTCDETEPSKCLSCYSSNFLKSDKCSGCADTCMTCKSAEAPSECTSCFDNYYLKGTECIKGCPKNCFTCSDATTCTECHSGYTLFNHDDQLICAPCVSSCRTCAEGQPSECLDCGEGFYLAGSPATCTPCPDNCATCTAAGCSACADDFFMTSEQTCAPNCLLPCATCSTSDPAQCVSCVAGYKYNDVSKTCVEIVSCASGCKACPMGYSLKEAECVACSTAKCQSCNVNNLTQCYSCKPTFYLNDAGTCDACPSQCKTCLSATGCLTCAAGYTKKKNGLLKAGGAECVACNAPCKTCAFTPNNCRSCIDGYNFFGWKCGQTFRFTFKLVLTVKLVVFNKNFFSLIRIFVIALRGSDTNAVTFNKITEGSVNIEGSAAPTGAPGSAEAAQQLQGLSDLIKSGNIAGMSVGQSSLIVDGGSVGALPSSSHTVGIILGICIPIGVLSNIFFYFSNRWIDCTLRIQEETEQEG